MGTEKATGSPDSTRAAAEEAVRRGEDISDEVRKLTVDALSNRRLDYPNIKSVVKAVLEGARDALSQGAGDTRVATGEVIKGLDEALEKTALASKLAIEEAAGNVKDFTGGDIKRGMDDLAALEEIFFDSLAEVAKSGETAATDTMQELLNHLRSSGTAVGRRVSEEIDSLTSRFENAGKENLDRLTDLSRSFTSDLAQIASGFLAGLSDSLKDKRSNNSSNRKKD